MPSVLSYTPRDTRRLLEMAGYSVVRETRLNWYFMRDHDDAPFLVPRLAAKVPLQIANEVARRVGMSSYIAWPAGAEEDEQDA